MASNQEETTNLRLIQSKLQISIIQLDEILQSLLSKTPEAWMINANLEVAHAELTNAVRRIDRIANALEYGRVYEADDAYKEWASLQSSLRSIRGAHRDEPEEVSTMEYGGETFRWSEDNGWLTDDEWNNFN